MTEKNSIESTINQLRNEALSYFNYARENFKKINHELISGLQSATANAIRQENRGSTDPLRVLFLVPHISLFDVFLPIYEAMKKDKNFVPEVLAFRRKDIEHDIDAAQTENFFKGLGISAYIVGFEDEEILPELSPETFDILFYTLGSTAYPEEYRIERTSFSFLTCYIAYGVLLANEPEYQYNQEFHHSSWRIFARSEEEKQKYDLYAVRATSNTIVTGYPKFDLFSKKSRSKPDSKPTIIWAPHWSIGLIYPALSFGTFDKYCMDMFKVFDDNPDINFIYKPHPNLQYALDKTSFMNSDSYKIYLDMLGARDNVEIYKDGDNIALFQCSTAMITDSISFLAEYLPTSKPLLFLDRPDRAKLNTTGEEIINLHYKADDIDGIKGFIANTIKQDRDTNKSARQKYYSERLEFGKIGASAQILANIKMDLLKTETPKSRKKFDDAILEAKNKQEAIRKEAKARSTQYWLGQKTYNYATNFPDRHKNQIDFTKKNFLPLLTKNSKVLDIGSADGWHACIIAHFCGELNGIDMNPDFIALARENAKKMGLENCHFETADALQLKIKPKFYDAIVLSGLTTCFVEDSDFLSVMRTATTGLKENGVLLLKDTLQTSKGSKLNLVNGYAALYRDLDKYNKLLDIAGFEISIGDWLQTDGESGSYMALAKFRSKP